MRSSIRGNPETGKPRTSAARPWRRAERTRPEKRTSHPHTQRIIWAKIGFAAKSTLVSIRSRAQSKTIDLPKPSISSNRPSGTNTQTGLSKVKRFTKTLAFSRKLLKPSLSPFTHSHHLLPRLFGKIFPGLTAISLKLAGQKSSNLTR